MDYRISKLVSKGILETIKPGFYLNIDLLSQSPQKEELVEYVGSVVKYPSYVSLEYALSKYGLIPESVFTVTYVTTKNPGEYNSKGYSFRYRNIKITLFTDYEERIFGAAKYLFAKRYKALFDFVYLTPLRAKSDFKNFLLDSRINWGNLSKEDKNNFTELCFRCGSKKMKQIVECLKDAKIL